MDYGRLVVVEDLASLSLEPSRPGVYDRDIHLRLLHQDPETGAEHYLVRYPPGLRGRAHRHTAAHTMVILEGRMSMNGRVVGAGTYVHFPRRELMHHAAAGDDGCLFVIIFDGPFDVEPVEE